MFSLMKSRKTAKNIMTRKVKYSNCEAVIGFYVSFMLLLICSVWHVAAKLICNREWFVCLCFTHKLNWTRNFWFVMLWCGFAIYQLKGNGGELTAMTNSLRSCHIKHQPVIRAECVNASRGQSQICGWLPENCRETLKFRSVTILSFVCLCFLPFTNLSLYHLL